MPGQVNLRCHPAWRCRALSARTLTECAGFVDGDLTPARLLDRPGLSVRPRKPIQRRALCRLAPPGGSLKEVIEAYSHFFIGLTAYYHAKARKSRGFLKFFEKSLNGPAGTRFYRIPAEKASDDHIPISIYILSNKSSTSVSRRYCADRRRIHRWISGIPARCNRR